MKKFIIYSAILLLIFVYPFFAGNSIFTTFDSVFGMEIFSNLWGKFCDIFKNALSPKAYKTAEILTKATWETLYMSVVSTIFAGILGLILAVILVLTRKNGLAPNPVIYGILDVIVNVFRSFPFLILIIVLLNFTKLIVGTSIGTDAAIVPLTIGTAPFMARMFENALIEVDSGIIESARSFGSSKMQIIGKVMLIEAIPSLINVITLTFIMVIGFSAMSGTLGGGGLGDVAIRFGFQRFNVEILTYTVIILIVMVQFVQFIGDRIYKRVKK